MSDEHKTTLTGVRYYQPYSERAPRLLIHGWPRGADMVRHTLYNAAYDTDFPGERAALNFGRRRIRRQRRTTYEAMRRKRIAHINHMRLRYWEPNQRYRFDNWPGFRDIKRLIMAVSR